MSQEKVDRNKAAKASRKKDMHEMSDRSLFDFLVLWICCPVL